MMDISQQETQKVPVPPQVPTPPKGTVGGIIALQPMPDGTALFQLHLDRLIAITGVVPADVVRAFVGEYLQEQKKNQALVQAVRRLSH